MRTHFSWGVGMQLASDQALQREQMGHGELIPGPLSKTMDSVTASSVTHPYNVSDSDPHQAPAMRWAQS